MIFQGYEERVYEAKKWVCTNFNNTNTERRSGYMRLHYYTQGNNTSGLFIYEYSIQDLKDKTKPICYNIFFVIPRDL